MSVDVVTEAAIAAPIDMVSRFSADPTNAPEWYDNIRSVRWETDPPLAVGTRVAFVARFLRRELAYTYEIVEFDPGVRLVMRTAQGPFPMATTYTWQPVDGGTRMTLRNQGAPKGFGRFAAAIMVPAMRRENRKDLAKLRTILESR